MVYSPSDKLLTCFAVRPSAAPPVVPSAVSYEVRQQGNALSNALGHGTHSHPTGTRTARGGCLCQHQAERGLDGWYGEHR